MKSKLYEEVKNILEYETKDLTLDELKEYANNPLNYSCENGCVTLLIYRKDTHKFTDRNYDEIIDLLKSNEICEMDKTKQAWIAFELLAQLALEDIIKEKEEESEL